MIRKSVLIVFTLMIFHVKAQEEFKSIDKLIDVGRYHTALTELKSLSPTFKSSYKIAILYDAIDNHKEAANYFKQALTFKDDYKTKVKLGKSLRKDKKITEAIHVYEDILKTDPENLLVKYALSKMYLQKGEAKKAKGLLQKLIKEDQNNANFHYQLGIANTALGKKYKRVDNFLDAYNVDAQHFNAIEKLARAFTKLRDKDSASIFINKGLALRPNHLNLNKLKINRLFLDKKYNESLLLLKNLDSIAPNEHYTNSMLGKTYLKLEQYDNAKKHFHKATKINNEDFKSYIYLGEIYLKQKEIKSAMYNFAMGSYMGKEKRDKAHTGLAKVYLEMKLPNRAIEEYKIAVTENANNYKALYELAKLSDNYYKDKKIGLRLYKRYLDRFENKVPEIDAFVKKRIKEIKKSYFLKGEIVE
ncbi:tetratricopeptide repeat protein [Tenacibaculum amylolyticum]|uniref:tetratricopeptide repeat protein n=1 Tax=Tenacibaculum amylolyticum TaxID=104269 RepID=UPI0038936FCB